jgi:hypothetical protein
MRLAYSSRTDNVTLEDDTGIKIGDKAKYDARTSIAHITELPSSHEDTCIAEPKLYAPTSQHSTRLDS